MLCLKYKHSPKSHSQDGFSTPYCLAQEKSLIFNLNCKGKKTKICVAILFPKQKQKQTLHFNEAKEIMQVVVVQNVEMTVVSKLYGYLFICLLFSWSLSVKCKIVFCLRTFSKQNKTQPNEMPNWTNAAFNKISLDAHSFRCNESKQDNNSWIVYNYEIFLCVFCTHLTQYTRYS